MYMQKTNYTAQQIQVQEGLNAVRTRPGMYIGSTDSDGLHHLIYEIVDNSIDEALAGYCNEIHVYLHTDNSVTIHDNGRGIPVDIHSDNLSAVEIVMTKLHAGGKFAKDAYKISGGLHGVGCAVVNALSSWCTAKVHREGKTYKQSYEIGTPTSALEIIGESSLRGTEISFLPDASIFKDTQNFDFNTLSHRLRELAYLNKNISIHLIDERKEPHKKTTYYSEIGIADFIKSLSKEKKPLIEAPITIKNEGDQSELEIALSYVSGQESIISAFVNSIYTKEGGTHLEGFKSALTRTFNKYLKQQEKLAKPLKGTAFTGSDVQAGLIAVLSLKIQEPTFSGQTKTKLSNTEVRGFVESSTSETLTQILDHNPRIVQTILEKCIRSALARIESQKVYDNTLRKTPLGNASLPGKLTDCLEKDPSKTEVFLVEGDSAGGSAKLGRDSTTQAILPLFGKPSNVEKMQDSITKIQNNAKLHPIIATLGTNISNLFDITKLRYNRVIIMADADVDGSHIRTLLLTFFFRYMKPLIENGNLYIAVPPLFLLKTKKEYKYAYSEKERSLIFTELQKKHGKQNIFITRFKGLGEMNDEELWETTMNPANRKLLQVTINDAIIADEAFTLLLGEDVAPRREFIEENAQKVVNLDI